MVVGSKLSVDEEAEPIWESGESLTGGYLMLVHVQPTDPLINLRAYPQGQQQLVRVWFLSSSWYIFPLIARQICNSWWPFNWGSDNGWTTKLQDGPQFSLHFTEKTKLDIDDWDSLSSIWFSLIWFAHSHCYAYGLLLAWPCVHCTQTSHVTWSVKTNTGTVFLFQVHHVPCGGSLVLGSSKCQPHPQLVLSDRGSAPSVFSSGANSKKMSSQTSVKFIKTN